MIATIISSLVCAAIAACFAHAWTAMHYRRIRLEESGDWSIRWVPAERALPKVGRSVLVAIKTADGKRYKTAFSRLCSDGKFSVSEFGEVVAWAARPRYAPDKHIPSKETILKENPRQKQACEGERC